MDSKPHEPARESNPTWRAWAALFLLVPCPSLGILSEMVWFPGALGLSILALGKVWLLAFPMVWTVAVEGQRLRWPRFTTRGLGLGLITGLVGALVVLASFELFLESRIDPTRVREMARENHFLDKRAFVGIAIYIFAVNSLLEEYVWRWFVFRQFERIVRSSAAVVLSAAAFTLHHTIILHSQ